MPIGAPTRTLLVLYRRACPCSRDRPTRDARTEHPFPARSTSKEGERDSGQGPEEQGIHLKPTAAWPYGSRISGSPTPLSYKTIISLRSYAPVPTFENHLIIHGELES